MQTKNLSIIIPAYLEAENLLVLLPRINAVLTSLSISYEVLIVDTMEPMDNTKEVCEQFGATYLPRQHGNNYGDAVRTGIAYASGEHTMFMDADGSHTPEFIKNLYNKRNEADVVIASRYVEGGNTDNPKILILMSLVVNIIYSIVLNLHCKDVSNSFKLYKTRHLKELSLSCDNFDIVEEILFKIKKKHKNLSIKELPFTFKKRMFGHTKRNLLVFILTYGFTLLKLRLSVDFNLDKLRSPFMVSLIRFCVVGLLGAFTNLLIFYASSTYLHTTLTVSAILAFMVAVTQNYIGNHLWSFAKKAKASIQNYTTYVVVNIISLIINILVLHALVRVGFIPLVAQAVAIVLGTVVSYAGSYLFVFVQKK